MSHSSRASWRSRSSSMLEAHSVPAVIIDADFKVLEVNSVCRGLANQKVVSGRTSCHELFHGCPVPTTGPIASFCPLRRCLSCRSPKQVQHYHQTATGKASHLVTVFPLPDQDGEVRAALQTCHPFGEGEVFVQTLPQVTRSEEMLAALDLIRRLAGEDLPVLLMGESGTGRRELAKLIHDLSPRREGPFVSLSCSGLDAGELRAELFGEQVSWSMGDEGYRIGLVDAARQGTIYVEEVADLGPFDQNVLLRMLRSEVPHDLRMVCSTAHPLFDQGVQAVRISPALFFRISRYPIPIPPLRRRGADLPALARILLAEVEPTRRMVLESETLEALSRYSFPGNLIELRSALIWATLMAEGESILPVHLPPRIQ